MACNISTTIIVAESLPLQGTAKRWDQVAAYVRTRTVEEVLDMVKHGLKSGKMSTATNGITKKRQVSRPLFLSSLRCLA